MPRSPLTNPIRNLPCVLAFTHAAQAFDLTDAPDKILNRHGLSRSERTGFRIHLAQSFIGTDATKS